MGVVTSRQRYANPLTDLDEVRLPNLTANKSAVSQSGQVIDNSSTAGVGEFHQSGPYAALQLWDIDDGKAPGFYTTNANGL